MFSQYTIYIFFYNKTSHVQYSTLMYGGEGEEGVDKCRRELYVFFFNFQLSSLLVELPDAL